MVGDWGPKTKKRGGENKLEEDPNYNSLNVCGIPEMEDRTTEEVNRKERSQASTRNTEEPATKT